MMAPDFTDVVDLLQSLSAGHCRWTRACEDSGQDFARNGALKLSWLLGSKMIVRSKVTVL